MARKFEEILKDELARKIISFFYENQSSIDSARGISTWVNRERDEVLPVLEELIEAKILERDASGATKGYCYTRNKEVMRRIDSIMKDT